MAAKVEIDKKLIHISLGTAAIIIIFLISMTANFATWKAEMSAAHQEFDDRITHVGDKVIDMRADIKLLEDKASVRDVELAKINTKLASIEALLLDIKSDLKTK